MSSRPRPTSQLPKSPTNLDPASIIDTHATLTGLHLITTGPRTVLHPRSRLNSTYSAIRLGSGCIVNERATIGLLEPPGPEVPDPAPEIVLGANVVVETGAQVSGASVGDGSVICAGATVLAGAVVGRNCRVGQFCVVRRGEVVPDGVVIYGDGRRRDQRVGVEALEDARRIAHEKQLEGLRRLIKSDLAKHGGQVAAPVAANTTTEQAIATSN